MACCSRNPREPKPRSVKLARSASPRWEPQRGKLRILVGGRQRIAQPLPGIALVGRRYLPLHDRQRPFPVEPAGGGLAAQHEIGPGVEDGQQVPELAHLGLDGGGGAEQHMPGPRCGAHHEVQQIVRRCAQIRLGPSQGVPAAGAVRLVQHQGPVATPQQMSALLGCLEDQPGGDDGDPKGAAGNILRAARLNDVPFEVDPYLLRGQPDGARDAELVGQLHLPLQGQGRWAQHQDRPVVQQGGHHGARRQRQGLAHPDLVRQQQADLAIGLPVSEEQGHEGALPGLELLAPAIDGALGERRRRQVPRRQVLAAHLHPLGNPPDLLHDGLRERKALGPQGREFLLRPGHARGRPVLPEDLVVAGKGALGLVDGAEKAGLDPIRPLDDPGLAVHEGPLPGHHPDLDPTAGQQLM